MQNFKDKLIETFKEENFVFLSNPNKFFLLVEKQEKQPSDFEVIALEEGIDKVIASYEQTLKRNYNSPSYRIDYRSLGYSFFEKLWSKLSSKAEKEVMYNLFKTEIFYKNGLVKELVKLNNNDYANDTINFYLNDNANNHYDENLFVCFLTINDINPNLKLKPNTLMNLCKKNTYILKKIGVQQQLKKVIESTYLDNIEEFKKFYKKVDTSLLEKSEENITESMAHVLTFKKVYLYNINPHNPEEEAVIRKIKSLVTFLNKTKVQETLNLNRVTLDGTGSGKDNFHFIFMTTDINFTNKDIVKNLIVKVAEMDNEPTIQEMQKLLNYEMLNRKLAVSTSEKKSSSKKI